MAESIAQRRARLQRELEATTAAENAQMERVLGRANQRVRNAIDQAAEDIAKASAELDGDTAVSADDIRSRLYEQYNIETEPPAPNPDDPNPEPVPTPELNPDDPNPNPEPPTPEPPTPEPEPEPEPEPRDQPPPPAHWSERKLFQRR